MGPILLGLSQRNVADKALKTVARLQQGKSLLDNLVPALSPQMEN
jgi:hypothetical protein